MNSFAWDLPSLSCDKNHTGIPFIDSCINSNISEWIHDDNDIDYSVDEHSLTTEIIMNGCEPSKNLKLKSMIIFNVNE